MKKAFLGCGLVLACVFVLAAQETTPISGKSPEGLLLFQSDDGKFSFTLDGRINLGAALYMGSDNPLGNGMEVRRARLGLKPTWGDWQAQFDIDFAGNEVDVKDMWIGYGGFKNMMITLGNHKGQYSVEEVTSSRYITFMERGLPNAFAPDRRLGLSVAKWGSNWRAFAGIFGEEAGSVDETGENEALNYNFRLSYAPILNDDMFIHLGGAYGYAEPFASDEGEIRFRARPESHVSDPRFVDTGKIKKVNHYNEYGLELAASVGPVLLQGEYMSVDVNRNENLAKARFSGYYAFASWMITGEKRPYSVEEGEPAGPIYVKKPSLGAFELAVRYSSLDLNDLDAGIKGGREDNLTFALNWYAYSRLRFMVNYILVNNDEYATANKSFTGNDDFSILQFGFYFMF